MDKWTDSGIDGQRTVSKHVLGLPVRPSVTGERAASQQGVAASWQGRGFPGKACRALGLGGSLRWQHLPHGQDPTPGLAPPPAFPGD